MKGIVFIVVATLGILASAAVYQSNAGAGTACAGISFLVAGAVALVLPTNKKERKK